MIVGAVGLAVIFFTVWTIFPLLYTFAYSFTDWQPLRAEQHFVGLANYEEALFKDPLFWTSVGNTLVFVIGNVLGGGALALVLALLINSVNHFKAFFRAAFFLPTITGVVAVSLVWSFIYQPRFGILNSVIFSVADLLHLPPPAEIGWLTRPQSAMVSIIIFGLWNYVGIRILIFLAGLQSIPKTYYEAAEIDGAGAWGKFWYVTLPLLRPSIVFVLITTVINSMQAFEPMFVMPAQPGGPLNSTRTIVLHIFDKTFTLYRFGYGAATSFILFVVIMIITVLQFRLLNRRLD